MSTWTVGVETDNDGWQLERGFEGNRPFSKLSRHGEFIWQILFPPQNELDSRADAIIEKMRQAKALVDQRWKQLCALPETTKESEWARALDRHDKAMRKWLDADLESQELLKAS